MKVLPARRWRDIVAGDTVILPPVVDPSATPRHVLAPPSRFVTAQAFAYLEGWPPLQVDPYDLITVVELDESDAIVNLLRAGLDVIPIAWTEQE
jgi:hypothetical protein